MNTDSQPEQPRQYGNASHEDEGLAKLVQAQSDEEAMTVEASLLVETNFSKEETENESTP